MAWLNFLNRKSLTITGSTDGAQTNYQLKLTVHKATGTDSATDVYLGTKVKDDFSDIRFTDADGITPLFYWVQDVTTGVSADVWICFDSIAAAPATTSFFIYYNDASATSASDGTNTFIFFDDGSSLSGWITRTPLPDLTIPIIASVVGGKIKVTPSSSGGSDGYVIFDTPLPQSSFKLGATIQASEGLTGDNIQGGLLTLVDPANNYPQANWYENVKYWFLNTDNNVSANSAVDNSFNASNPHNYLLLRTPTSETLYVDGSAKVSLSYTTWNPLYIGLHNYFQNGLTSPYQQYNNIFVANYTANEPAISAWGNEQTNPNLPVVSTNTASKVGYNYATLSGSLTKVGGNPPVSVFIKYGPTQSYGTTVQASPGSFISPGSFSFTVRGLPNNTVYHYAAYAVDAQGNTSTGTDMTFKTGYVQTIHDTVVQTIAGFGVNPLQRETFFANGLYWWFFYNANNIYYQTSPDNVTWSVATVFRSLTAGNNNYFSFKFDGTYAHYALWDGNVSIYYRRFTPNTDGSVTFSAAEQQAVSSSDSIANPIITVSPTGYPAIGYTDFGTFESVMMTLSNRNDGIWSTVAGFPYQVWAGTNGGPAAIVPVAGGFLYLYVTSDAFNSDIYSRFYNGGWNTQTHIFQGDFITVSAVTDGSRVYLAYSSQYNSIDYAIYFCTWTLAGGWTTPVQITSAGGPSAFVCATYDSVYNQVIVFACGSGVVSGNELDYEIYDCASQAWLVNTWTAVTTNTNLIGQPSSIEVGPGIYGLFFQSSVDNNIHYVNMYHASPLSAMGGNNRAILVAIGVD